MREKIIKLEPWLIQLVSGERLLTQGPDKMVCIQNYEMIVLIKDSGSNAIAHQLLSARSGKVKLLAIGLPLVHTLLIEVTHATTTIEFNSGEFHGCVPGCIDITQGFLALIVVRLVVDRVQSTFYPGVNGGHRASVKLSLCKCIPGIPWMRTRMHGCFFFFL